MKRVFVVGNYASKSQYQRYLKVIRNLQKNYNVVSMIDSVDDVSENKSIAYNNRDIIAIRQCDYVVAYIPGSVSSVNASFLAGYAVAIGKPLFLIMSDYSNSLNIVCSSTASVLYSKTIGVSKPLILENIIGVHQKCKNLV